MKSARRAAYDALSAVTKDGAFTSLALKESLPSDMPDTDRKFVSALVRTTLENLLKIDYVLDKFIKTSHVHGSVRNILRLGACQIMFMSTEEYASVNESVQLAKQIKPQTSGFVNAVLRSLSNNKDNIVYPEGENVQALSIEYSYPLWICEKYISDFGYKKANEILSAKPSSGTHIRMNTLKTTTEDFIKELKTLRLDYSIGSIKNSYIINGLTDIENTELYRKGWIAVQSESAMKAVIDSNIKCGTRLLDCCAAPGGKSAYAAALADNTLDITAWDIYEHRVDMTRKNFKRLGVNNSGVELHDATEFKRDLSGSFDTVIVDAPCSSMGLMAKSPDVRYNRNPEDIASLSEKQYKIFSVCSGYVKPGGVLAYYTCSINREENEQVTDRFIAENINFKYKREPETLYPYSGSDGFYIAVMERKP